MRRARSAGLAIVLAIAACAGVRAQAGDPGTPALRLALPGAPAQAEQASASAAAQPALPGWVVALSAGGAIAGGGVLAWLGLRSGGRQGGGSGAARTDSRPRVRMPAREGASDGLSQTMHTAIARRGTLGAANPAEVAAFRAMARAMGVHRAEQVRLLAQARTLGLPTALGLLLVEPIRERR